MRDLHGVRPLCIGKLPGGWVIASETAALDIVGATLVREVDPGEVMAFDEHDLRVELVASDLRSDDVAANLGANLLDYVWLEALTETTAGPGPGARGLRTACFTGNSPIPIPGTAAADLRPSAATESPTLPLPNP